MCLKIEINQTYFDLRMDIKTVKSRIQSDPRLANVLLNFNCKYSKDTQLFWCAYWVIWTRERRCEMMTMVILEALVSKTTRAVHKTKGQKGWRWKVGSTVLRPVQLKGYNACLLLSNQQGQYAISRFLSFSLPD